ncbi:MAG TPA: hypothetical protein VLH81_07870 [Desulfobacterales bacterium]|nr:hypothetical protein [Desulfobacterales bacterium]
MRNRSLVLDFLLLRHSLLVTTLRRWETPSHKLSRLEPLRRRVSLEALLAETRNHGYTQPTRR